MRTTTATGPGVADLGPGVMLTALWSGLVVGLVELVVTLGRVRFLQHGVLRMGWHQIWMTPCSVLAIFLVSGAFLSLLARLWPRIGRPLSYFMLGLLAFLMPLMAIPGLRWMACLAMAVGLACWAVPAVSARRGTFRGIVSKSLPALALILLALGALGFAKNWRVYGTVGPAGPLAVSDASNVVLIVLDTVRADATSLDGEGRDTTPNLRAFAQRGVRFDRAISTASWTLPSHASMFTGRFPREFSVGVDHPLDARYPTLAEFLGGRGYQTAGFVANTLFCGREYGIGRGFGHYEDTYLSPVEVLRSSGLGWLLCKYLGVVLDHVYANLGREPRHPFGVESIRKDAKRITDDGLRWISAHSQTPFFAFLNYLDAHDPYLASDESSRRYGPRRRTLAEYRTLRNWLAPEAPKTKSPADIALAVDAYDDSIAFLDDHLGRFFEGLERLGKLENTIVIITADHGEHFGEHKLDGVPLFGHGASLYQPEVHVPLVMVSPKQIPSGGVVAEPVSLRDLPATVVSLLGLEASSPFPGAPLRTPSAEPNRDNGKTPILSELALHSPVPAERRYIEADAGLMQSLISENKVYHYRGNGHDEIFDLEDDPDELHNLADDEGNSDLLNWFRDALRDLGSHPVAAPTRSAP